MARYRIDIDELYRGEGVLIRVRFVKSDGTAPTVTGWSATLTVRDRNGIVGTFTVGGTPSTAGGAIDNSTTAGVILATLNSVWTAARAPGIYSYDLLIGPDDGRQPFFPFGGSIKIAQPSTRPT